MVILEFSKPLQPPMSCTVTILWKWNLMQQVRKEDSKSCINTYHHVLFPSQNHTISTVQVQ